MIIYNLHNSSLIKKRVRMLEEIFNTVPVQYCFVTGSFLYKERYNDIDVFVITRSKKELTVSNKKVKITIIEFNDLHSLLSHSLMKSCVAKNILPLKPLKVTLTDYWHVINEAVPTLLNQKRNYHKEVRFLVLYTEYMKNGVVLDSFELDEKVHTLKTYHDVLNYVKENVPQSIRQQRTTSYLKKFMYTQAGLYKKHAEYKAQRFLYQLAHSITQNNGRLSRI